MKQPGESAGAETLTPNVSESDAAPPAQLSLLPPAMPQAQARVGTNMFVPMPSRAMYPFGWSRGDVSRAALVFFTILLGGLFLYRVQVILPPFLIAFGLAALLDPTLRYNEQRGRSRVYTIALLYFFMLCLLAITIVWVIPALVNQVTDVSQNLSQYYNHIQQTANEFMGRNVRALDLVGIKQHRVADLLNAKSGPVQASIAATLGSMSGLVQAALSKVLWLVIIPISSFFFMRDFPILRARLILLFPEPHHARIHQLSHDIVDVFTAYLRGLAKICTLYACVACLMFSLLNVRYALLLGILGGLFYAVPYVGNLLTATAAATIAFLMDAHPILFWNVPAHSLPYAVVVAVCCIVMANIVFDQLVYPRVVGGSVGLHPVVSIFSLMAGATVFGVWGMLLATPVAASIQIVLMCLFPKLTQKPPGELIGG